MPRRYVKIENGKVVEQFKDHPGGPKPEDKVVFDFGDRKPPKSKPKRSLWDRFQVHFLETLALLLAFIILGAIGALFIFVIVLTIAPNVGR